MADDPNDFIPPFVSPLTHDQHARVGRIAVLWGQIDLILDQLLDTTLGISPKQRMSLIGEKPIGAKLEILSRHLDDIEDEQTRDLARRFWDLANQTKTLRNRCFHGVWGFRCARKNAIVPAAGHWRAQDDPLRLTQLPALEKKLCKTANVGFKAVVRLHKFKNDHFAVRLFHGTGEPPAWLGEWISQHPLDDRALDRSWKVGRLPYLKQPV